MTSHRTTTLAAAALAVATALSTAPATATGRTDAPPGADVGADPYRPAYHYTPERNWVNDPNGLVFHDGEYHLFYQHNPNGTQWGDMSWGHAVSRDLVRWEELPLAIPHDQDEYVFSGSAVVDHRNTSGFGSVEDPPMVAVYTSARRDGPGQDQALAYSLDNGRTWQKYEGNPVLDLDNEEFRDPKVTWQESTGTWLMAVALATEKRIAFYSSPDLKEWTHLSDFGPQGAVGGVWECPDLFRLPVDGDPDRQKWVLVVSLNPGGPHGGSGMQYFVGEWDGTTFTPDDDGSYEPPPALRVLADFEGDGFGEWTVTGDAFGDGPVAGRADGTDQSGVTGYLGERLANSFHRYDAGTGTLTSPEFTVDAPYLNLLVGGGRHPHDPGAVLDPEPPVAARVVADFEGGAYGEGWVVEGEAFGDAPATGTLPGQQAVTGFQGAGLVNTFVDGDRTTGVLTSPEFELTHAWVNLLVGGGRHPMTSDAPTAVNLLVDGEVVRTATGRDEERLSWRAWDVTDLTGRSARLQVVDANTGGWGHVNVDSVMLSDAPAQRASTETTVQLLVDGEVVDSATGANSGVLDWASFDLRRWQGRTARVRAVDANPGGWGQVLVDHVVLAAEPALSALQRADWLDHGKDYYAAVAWDGDPTGTRRMIGWMSNWQYAGATPTGTWRGAMSVPRQVGLQTVDGEVRLVQQPVGALERLRGRPLVTGRPSLAPTGTSAVTTRTGTTRGLPVAATSFEVDATFAVGDADAFGLRVRVGDGQETVVGYDVARQEVYVDRTRSGVDLGPDFSGRHAAPLVPVDGSVRLRVLVDSSSVEVFGGQGEAVVTSLVFPDPASDGIELFSDGAATQVESLRVWELDSYRSTGG
ncbi:GH32 C-terminal domain-containing protein [Thalassiella azotivora]